MYYVWVDGLAMYWYGCGYFGFWLWNGWEGRGKVAWLAGITLLE